MPQQAMNTTLTEGLVFKACDYWRMSKTLSCNLLVKLPFLENKE